MSTSIEYLGSLPLSPSTAPGTVLHLATAYRVTESLSLDAPHTRHMIEVEHGMIDGASGNNRFIEFLKAVAPLLDPGSVLFKVPGNNVGDAGLAPIPPWRPA